MNVAPDAAAETSRRGTSFPLGATVHPDGVNFSVFSRQATRIELLLFESVEQAQPSRVIGLDPRSHRTYHYWHVFVPGIGPGQLYGYRAFGPYEPERGLRFDPSKTLLDPYGRAVVVPEAYSRTLAGQYGSTDAIAMKSAVVDTGAYDWEFDAPLHRSLASTVIYEMHVAGFTRHPSSGVSPERRGTYAGMIEKIPYLQELGITAVELLPVFHFDGQDCPPGLVNYWGYSPVSFFAPHAGYSSRRDPLGPLDEFRDLVKALHRAGIEVILDVVYNHTAEGNAAGPTLCFRGLANEVYYLLEDRSRYANYSGTGNTLNANQTIVRRMILDSLRYWVREMHVDGFRFDLAAILARDESGRPLENPPALWDIESDPVLAGTKLIAEAWDAAGLYQVGSFVGDSWLEWNGVFRDDVRGFLRGDRGTVRNLPQRVLGSPDIFAHKEREPEQSVNFVTCHDGFTLNDLVSYDDKHNEANGEGNRDGTDGNRSWNCGVEGPTEDPAVEGLRRRQVKNFLVSMLFSMGTPMLLMGDEIRRSQRGNNNAYCQDNEVSWLDWELLERHRDLHRLVRMAIGARLRWRERIETSEDPGLSLTELLRQSRFDWHGIRLGQPDWGDDSHSLACTVRSGPGRLPFWLHLMFNAYWEPLDFELPPVPGIAPSGWRRWVDTALESPEDIVDISASAPLVPGTHYRVMPRSIAMLFLPVDARSGPTFATEDHRR